MGATGTTYDFAMIAVECEQCDEVSQYKVREIEHVEKVKCRYCRADIDLSSPEWRGRISAAVETSKQVKIL